MKGALEALRAQREAQYTGVPAEKILDQVAPQKPAGKSKEPAGKLAAGYFTGLATAMRVAFREGSSDEAVGGMLKSAFGRVGGIARAAKLSPERMSEIGRMGGSAPRKRA